MVVRVSGVRDSFFFICSGRFLFWFCLGGGCFINISLWSVFFGRLGLELKLNRGVCLGVKSFFVFSCWGGVRGRGFFCKLFFRFCFLYLDRFGVTVLVSISLGAWVGVLFFR